MSAAPQLKEGLKYQLKIIKGPLAGQTFKFEHVVLMIGRGPENGLVLANDLRASRSHAEIRWDGFELHIYNLSKKNAIVVDGQPTQSAKLTSGMVIGIGETELKIEFDQESKTQLHAVEPVESTPAPYAPPMPAPDLIPDPNEVPVVMKSNPILQPTSNKPTPKGYGAPPVNYTAPMPGVAMGAPAYTRPKTQAIRSKSDNGRVRFYGIIVVVGLLGWWLMSSSAVKKKELTFRSTEQIEQELAASQEEIKEFEARKEKLDSVQYKRAQENYIRGFRDYKQGNYGRARESFQVVLNLDPDNELAKRYYHLSKVKFDELVKFNMLQGNRYRDKKNWRMCKSSYFNVMTMLNNNQDPVFKEAKQYYDQCSLAEEGRF